MLVQMTPTHDLTVSTIEGVHMTSYHGNTMAMAAILRGKMN